MNFNHLLSGPGAHSSCIKNNEDMCSQGFLRLGQKRSNEHLVDLSSASDVITRKKLEADPKNPSRSLPKRPHLSGLSLSSSTPKFNLMTDFGLSSELGFGVGGTTDRFTQMDARAANNISKTKRLFDSLSSKAMPPSGYGGYNCENGFMDSECEYNRQHLFSVSARGLEGMRRALGKDLDTSSQNEVKNFTLNGEQVDKTTEHASSEDLQEVPAPVTRGLLSLRPYLDENGSPGADKVTMPYFNYTLARGFYRRAFPDLYGNNSIIFGPSASAHGSLCLKIGRHTTEPSTLFSFETCNSTAMQEAVCNSSGISPAEAGTSKTVLKSVTMRKKDRDGSNIFPANVKSLLSTGIFDGVSVKYVSWDRTKYVRGTIHGTSYLCWCGECKKLKMVNAYQLEQHAGSKSKHPNDHIYFSNGKSIYGVVQELKNTPSDKLLERIPTMTGSGINTENFSKWKESFQAAGRELQRIFGSDEPGETTSSKNEVVQADRECDRPPDEQFDAASCGAV